MEKNNNGKKDNYIDPIIENQIYKKLKDDDEVLGIFEYEQKHYMIITPNALINWNRTPIIGKFNRIRYNRISFVTSTRSTLYLTIDDVEYDYKGFFEIEISELIDLIKARIYMDQGLKDQNDQISRSQITNAELETPDEILLKFDIEDGFEKIVTTIKLTSIHVFVLIILYIIFSNLSEIINNLFSSDARNTLGLIYVFISLFLFLFVALLSTISSYIFTLSYSKQFICRMGAIHTIRIGLLLTFEILVFTSIPLMIVGFVLRNAESIQDLLNIVALTTLIFTIFVFYYVQEWVFNNKDDIVLGDTPNREYWNYENVKQLF